MALTPAGDIKETTILAGLGASPTVVPTSGEGAAATPTRNEDLVAVTASNVQNSVYYMGPRFPTYAKVKKVQMYGKGIDTNASVTVAYDVNIIFSDAPVGGLAGGPGVVDGTPYSQANQIPTSALTGAVTSVASYTSPNKMFGSAVTPVGASGAAKIQDLTWANTFTFAMSQLPLWSALGFAVDPGGFFNFFIVQTANSATAAVGTLGMIIDYVA